MQTLIYRHRKENLKKCSLRGLESHPDLQFFTYPTHSLPDLSSYLLLEVGAPPLTSEDAHLSLLIIDATWRLTATIRKTLPVNLPTRSLPTHFRTAYPRKQTQCPNPQEGLASIEALYLAHKILNRSTKGLLETYLWKTRFLSLNGL